MLGVYTGSTASNLTVVASDNNSLGGTNRSRVTFTPNPCATYHIAVDGLWAASGYITFPSTRPRRHYSSARRQLVRAGSNSPSKAIPSIYAIDASTDLTNWVQLGFVTNACSTSIPVTDIRHKCPKTFLPFRSP